MKRLNLLNWIEINSEKYESITQQMIQYVSIALDIPPHIIEDWDVDDLMDKYSTTKWINQPINHKDAISSLDLSDVKLNLIDYNTITFGQFIDLEHLIKDGYIDNISRIVCTLYLQSVKEKFKKAEVENYGDVDIEERSQYILDKVSINEVYGSIQAYFDWRERLFDSYSFWDSGLDDINPDELNEEELEIYNEEVARMEKNSKTMWEDILAMVSGGDITKYEEILGTNVFMVFNRVAKIISERKSNK